jgi:hypothetical protein
MRLFCSVNWENFGFDREVVGNRVFLEFVRF